MTRAGRSNYKPFWGRCQFPRSTHTLLRFTGGRSGYFGGKVIGAEVGSFPSRSRRTGISLKASVGHAHAAQSPRKRGVFIRTSEMRSSPPCALRHWQRLQPASRWRLYSYSFSADRLPTFIVYSPRCPPIPGRTFRYVSFDIVSH